MSARFKFFGITLLVVANFILLKVVHDRRAHSPQFSGPPLPQEWKVTLSERTSEDRERVLAAAFALANFEVKPLEELGEVRIPRPKKWFEEMVISTSYVNDREGKGAQPKETSRPWNDGPVNVAMRSVSVVAYDTVPDPESKQVVVKEKLVGLDTYITKNGIELPSTDLFAAGRYFVDKKENTLLKTQRAVQINGQAIPRYQSDIPHWLFPSRTLAVGESWVQQGAHPDGIPQAAPVPEAFRKLSRLVLFEGRRAAEIESTSTVYEFIPGPAIGHVMRQEQTLSYLDLETGEPLWFESRDKDERDTGSVVRGCNQIFVKHLIRTKKPKG